MMDQEQDTKWFSRGVYLSIFGFVFGILVSSFIFVSPLLSILILVVAVAALLSEKIYNRVINFEVILFSLLLTFFALGTLRYSIKDFHEPIEPSGEGIVVSEPEQKDNATRFVFESDNGERALVSAGLYDEVQYGDRVKVEGKFEIPGIIESDDGRDFDYAKYLSKDDIYYTVSFAKVEVLDYGYRNPLKANLLKLKKNFLEKIKETFTEPYASLLAGLIVSGRDAMPKDYLEELRRAGVIHIVVLSGYNITIIAEFLRKLFEKLFLLTRFTAIPLLASGTSIIGILLFVLMTGAEATVVRAAIMVLTVIVAKMFGRRYSAPRALVLAGFIMLLENPKILVFDPSFQLSFLATLALIYVVPIFEKWLQFIPEKLTLRTTIATTIATQITVLPLLVYSVGDISLVSLPANILVLLVIPYTMFLGFIATTMAYISSLLAWPLAYVTHLLLAWIFGVSGFFGNINFSSISIPTFSFSLVFIAYTLMGILIYKTKAAQNGAAL